MSENPAAGRSPRLANPRRFAVLAVIGLALAAALLFWARPLIRELVVLPLSYLFWAVGVFFRSTPEQYFWTALLIIAALAAWRSLIRPKKTAAELPPDLLDDNYDRPFRGQVSLWRLKVNNMRSTESTYLRSTFEQAVGKLLFDTLSHRYHLSAGEIEERLRADTLDVPPAVRDYALNSLRRLDSIEPQGAAAVLRAYARRAWRWLRALAGRRAGDPLAADPRLAQDAARLNAVLAYMEKDLEVPNDDAGQ